MFEWISQNSDMLQVVLNGLMVIIWITYLHIFLISFRRQQRTDLLINMGAGAGLQARCFVSNLGLEPLYLLDVLVEITTKDEITHEAVITDRSEMSEEQMNSPSEATNQGPLKSGDFIDIGSFNDLLERASRKLDDMSFDGIRLIKITALAKTSSDPQIVGACRTYRLQRVDGRIDVIPTKISATQIRSWWGRWKLRRKMNQRLEEKGSSSDE